MPIEHLHTIKAGSTRQLFFIYAADELDEHRAKTGLAGSAAHAIVAFAREGESHIHDVALKPTRLGEWVPGSFAEVDSVRMPGVYQFGAPDEMLAAGATRVMLSIRFPGAVIRPTHVSLVAFDPQDSERMGVWGLANSKRHEFLRRALPRLTEMELALGEQAEAALKAQIAPEA